MIRTFSTHSIRPQKELTGHLWDFIPCQGEYAGQTYKVATPCCWENHPDFAAYRGEGIYRTVFRANGNIRLEFKGVSHTATVFLDGSQIASHYNAYTPFSVIIKNLPDGEHTLEIKADNRFSEASALHVPNDYMSYGGISRPIVLEKLQNVYIEYIHITPYTRENIWHAHVEAKLTNIDHMPHTVDLSTSLAGKTAAFHDVTLDTGAETILHTDIVFENVSENIAVSCDEASFLETWTPENPKLYTATAVLKENGQEIDDMIDRFGFREITIQGKNILLNGRVLRIKGICRHEDHPQFGCALPYTAIAYDLDLAKHLGANALRTVHYPNDEIFLDLCDEQGFLVWEENHARGLELPQMQNPHFEEQAEQVIREMIPLHYNHPSIIIWGILNECASETEYGKNCYEKQFAIIKELDQSRPRTFASCKFKTDLCLGLPEVVSYNIYPKWYLDISPTEYIDDLYQWIQEETDGKGKPFIISEIGAGGLYGYRNPQKSKWTEEYQAEALKHQLTACLEYPNCSGVFIWQFCDIRISEEWFFSRPRSMNNKGIVDEYRRRKLAYDVVKQIFQSYDTYVTSK